MNRLGKLAVATTVVFWTLGNLIVRDTSLTGPQIAFWRYLVAAGIYTVAHMLVVGPIRLVDAKSAAPTAFAITTEIVVFFIAIKQTTVANVTVIGSMTPLLLFGVAARRFSERIPLGVIIGTLIAFGGVAMVVFGSSDAASWSLEGDVLAFIALLLFAAYFVFAKIARQSMPSLTLQTHTLLQGIPLLLVVTVVDSGGLSVPSGDEWLSVFGLILFPTTGHLLINWAHAHVSLTLASLMTLGVPVLSAIGAAVLFDEPLVAVQILGISLVLVVLGWAIVQTNRIRPLGT